MKTRVLVGGTVIGALTGLGAAYLMVKSSESEGTELTLSPADGVRIGLTVMGLLRLVASIGGGK
ncbi:MAG: hypothetical protein R3335_00505 [Anaerolineales bacterium]|nr:hypothetical protein [Anaerolineales bacterium]